MPIEGFSPAEQRDVKADVLEGVSDIFEGQSGQITDAIVREVETKTSSRKDPKRLAIRIIKGTTPKENELLQVLEDPDAVWNKKKGKEARQAREFAEEYILSVVEDVRQGLAGALESSILNIQKIEQGYDPNTGEQFDPKKEKAKVQEATKIQLDTLSKKWTRLIFIFHFSQIFLNFGLKKI